ncbi:MAG: trypsin-like peptidase domain-containing protein [Bdellovibrionaceae bacterium]|nr:trypsin-like peptidase domain-containing protein [Pseudobdellovibrionaceae bacterium]
MTTIASLFLSLALSATAHAKVIGSNDLVVSNGGAVNLPHQVREAVDTVGLISMGCTGTHIGSNLVLTAGHCFLTLPAPIGDNYACPDITIQWGVRGDRRGLVSRCLRVVSLQLDRESDWAVFEVDRAPIKYSTVNIKDRVQPNQVLTVLSHPEGRPLEWSRRCKMLPFVSRGNGPRSLHHQCDTQPGSSGAPVYDLETMQVIGVHNGGFGNNVNGAGTVNYGTYVNTLPWQRIIAKARTRGQLRPLPGSVF